MHTDTNNNTTYNDDNHDHHNKHAESQREQGNKGDGQGGTQDRQDGYRDTQGSGYASPDSHPDASKVGAQEGYDPTHSGVRHAQNKPGQPVDVPGRETGTAWGEDQQMGKSTDTPDRRNPAQ